MKNSRFLTVAIYVGSSQQSYTDPLIAVATFDRETVKRRVLEIRSALLEMRNRLRLTGWPLEFSVDNLSDVRFLDPDSYSPDEETAALLEELGDEGGWKEIENGGTVHEQLLELEETVSCITKEHYSAEGIWWSILEEDDHFSREYVTVQLPFKLLLGEQMDEPDED